MLVYEAVTLNLPSFLNVLPELLAALNKNRKPTEFDGKMAMKETHARRRPPTRCPVDVAISSAHGDGVLWRVPRV